MGVLGQPGFGLIENALSFFSLLFLAFLSVTIVLYYVLPKKTQWIVLLAASLVFYLFAGTPYTIVYVLISTFVTWWAAICIDKYRQSGKEKKNIRRVYLVALLTNAAILFLLKYTNFVLGNTSAVASLITGKEISWHVSWAASLGVSFYTLQIISYLTDCYWGITEPQKNYAKVALFSCFFPQMVSGPISRYDQLKDQLYAEHEFKKENLFSGLIRIAVGFFKKLVIAENFRMLAEFFFSEHQIYSQGIFTILGVVCYVIELYGDFAGCMDMVLGAAKCFGIDVVENFNKPFTSLSIQEFWQRWHITLGTWLKDYIMYPILRSKAFQRLGKTLKKKANKHFAQKVTTYLAMLILWFCMGLWHGGGWNYIAEGLWFWAVIVIGQETEPFFDRVLHTKDKQGKLITFFRRARTTCIYAVGAIFFRGPGVIDALKIIYKAVFPRNIAISLERLPAFLDNITTIELNGGTLLHELVNSFIGLLIFLLVPMWENKHGKIQDVLTKRTVIFQITMILFIAYLIIFLGVYGFGYRPSDFIYGGF